MTEHNTNNQENETTLATDEGQSYKNSHQEGQGSDEFAETGEFQEQSQEQSKYSPGQILRFIRVRFPGNARSFPFLIGKRRISYGQKVVALSDRGMAVGYINSFPYDVPYSQDLGPIRSISKIATEEDVQKDRESYRQQKEAEAFCNEKIEYYRLDMVLTHLEFTQYGKKAVFYFIAPQRVDFRDLVKDLVHHLKMRVELRQISVRDRTAAIGGIGPCGRELCCSSFLTRYGNVGIKMAKNQNLTMNPGKLNGVCGQLKCCIKFEDEVYSEKRDRLPLEGKVYLLENGDRTRVQRLHLLIEQFEGITDQGCVRRYSVNQYNSELKLPQDYRFPEQFESITIENDKVIGLDQYEEDLSKKFESELNFDFSSTENLAFNYFRGNEESHVLSEKEEEEKYDSKSLWEKENEKLFPSKSLAQSEVDEEDEDNEEDETNLVEGEEDLAFPEMQNPTQSTHSHSPKKPENRQYEKRDHQGQQRNSRNNFSRRPQVSSEGGSGQRPDQNHQQSFRTSRHSHNQQRSGQPQGENTDNAQRTKETRSDHGQYRGHNSEKKPRNDRNDHRRPHRQNRPHQGKRPNQNSE